MTDIDYSTASVTDEQHHLRSAFVGSTFVHGAREGRVGFDSRWFRLRHPLFENRLMMYRWPARHNRYMMTVDPMISGDDCMSESGWVVADKLVRPFVLAQIAARASGVVGPYPVQTCQGHWFKHRTLYRLSCGYITFDRGHGDAVDDMLLAVKGRLAAKIAARSAWRIGAPFDYPEVLFQRRDARRVLGAFTSVYCQMGAVAAGESMPSPL